MHINTRVDDAKAKRARRIALDLDHGGWPEIVARALDLYIEQYAQKSPLEVGRTNSDGACEE